MLLIYLVYKYYSISLNISNYLNKRNMGFELTEILNIRDLGIKKFHPVGPLVFTDENNVWIPNRYGPALKLNTESKQIILETGPKNETFTVQAFSANGNETAFFGVSPGADVGGNFFGLGYTPDSSFVFQSAPQIFEAAYLDQTLYLIDGSGQVYYSRPEDIGDMPNFRTITQIHGRNMIGGSLVGSSINLAYLTIPYEKPFATPSNTGRIIILDNSMSTINEIHIGKHNGALSLLEDRVIVGTPDLKSNDIGLLTSYDIHTGAQLNQTEYDSSKGYIVSIGISESKMVGISHSYKETTPRFFVFENIDQ